MVSVLCLTKRQKAFSFQYYWKIKCKCGKTQFSLNRYFIITKEIQHQKQLKMALNLVVKIHPVVLFQIVDAYERRNADSHRVIGTLLGTSDKGVVEVTNCFCVPHKEHADQVEAELNYAMDVYELNRRVNGGESVVGWWATGDEVTNHSSVIHEYYARECREPVHVTLDTGLAGARMGLRAYVCVALGVPRGRQGCMFTPIEASVAAYEPEAVALALCRRAAVRPQPQPDLAQVAAAGARLAASLERLLAHVEDVLAERVPADAAAGRALLQLALALPSLAADSCADALAAGVKDLLMVVTLSQLVKTQLQLNEKLTLLTSQ